MSTNPVQYVGERHVVRVGSAEGSKFQPNRRSNLRTPQPNSLTNARCRPKSGVSAGSWIGLKIRPYQPTRFRFKFLHTIAAVLKPMMVTVVVAIVACRSEGETPDVLNRVESVPSSLKQQPQGLNPKADPISGSGGSGLTSETPRTYPSTTSAAGLPPRPHDAINTTPPRRDPDLTPPAANAPQPNVACGMDTESDRARIAKEMAASEQIDRERELGKQRAEQARQQIAKTEALVAKMDRCAASSPGLDPMCEAMAAATETPCDLLSNPEESLGCRALATLAVARRTKDAKPCSKVAEKGMRALCVGVATGSFECPRISGSPFASACSWMAAGGDRAECPASGADRQMSCDAYFVTSAMARLDPTLCERIELERTRKACVAFVQNDTRLCPKPSKPGPHCREVVLGAERIPDPGGVANTARVRLWVVNLFEDTADCDAHLEVRQDGRLVASKIIDIGKLTVLGQVAEITTSMPVPAGDMTIDARGECRWIAAPAKK